MIPRQQQQSKMSVSVVLRSRSFLKVEQSHWWIRWRDLAQMCSAQLLARQPLEVEGNNESEV